MIPLAHGVGTRSDLPLPLSLVLYGAGMAVAISFAALLLLWRTPKLTDAGAGLTLPSIVQRIVNSRVLRAVLRALVLAVAVLVLAVALLGPPESNRNLAVWVLYVTFWVGLIPASLLLGPIWRTVNPLRTVHAGIARFTGPPPAAGKLPELGYWPAAASLIVFVWLELVYPDRALPGTVGIFLIVYSGVQLIAAMWFGAGWFARGDGFEVYSTLLATLSPLGRRDDGRLILRNPLQGPPALRAEAGLAAVVIILVGSTAFDGLSRTPFWQEGYGSDNGVISGTVGLTAMIVITGVLYIIGTVGVGRFAGLPVAEQFRLYSHTVIPIALGYSIAHYVSLLLLDGQLTWILASNPFGQDGVDLFGTYGNAVDLTAVGPEAIARMQLNAIVLGHVVGVVLAHDQALRAQKDVGARTQLPLVIVMIAYTVGGLALLFGGG